MGILKTDLYNELFTQLDAFNNQFIELPGLADPSAKGVFVKQLVDSIRRVQYVYTIKTRGISHSRYDTTSEYFDPLRAAVHFKRIGHIDEAFWLVFLSIHFGKALKTGWRLARDIYGSLGQGQNWTWERVSQNPSNFKQWLDDSQDTLENDGVKRHFGNHRKYESIRSDANRNTGIVVESYVNWVRPSMSHEQLINTAIAESNNDPGLAFDHLYKSLNNVISFGRTAKFDYLTMLGKLGLAGISPNKTYMTGATGPAKGARLLFGGNRKANINTDRLEKMLLSLCQNISVGNMGMQVLEDALCNWQKSPNIYKLFKG